MIITIIMNPAVDKRISLEKLIPEKNFAVQIY